MTVLPLRPPRWRPVHGYVGLYEVSDHGQVRSLSRPRKTPAGGTYMSAERILRPGGRHYLMVALTDRRGETERLYVHRLVLDAFLGAARGRQGRHRNGDTKDNALINLFYLPRPARNAKTVVTGRLKNQHAPSQYKVTSRPGERWRDVPGYEAVYAVSNLGRVKVMPRERESKSGGVWMSRAQLLRPSRARYSLVALTDAAGKVRRVAVHLLVLQAFVGPAPAKHRAEHIDGKDHNNRLDNLRWKQQRAPELPRRSKARAPTAPALRVAA